MVLRRHIEFKALHDFFVLLYYKIELYYKYTLKWEKTLQKTVYFC